MALSPSAVSLSPLNSPVLRTLVRFSQVAPGWKGTGGRLEHMLLTRAT